MFVSRRAALCSPIMFSKTLPGCLVGLLAVMAMAASSLLAQSPKRPVRRDTPPTFTAKDTEGVFFDKWSDGIQGVRPPLGKRDIVIADGKDPRDKDGDEAAKSRLSTIMSPGSLEDEVKRVRLLFDSDVTTPSAFRSGGFQDARLHLTVLATLFAVIQEHNEDVRWKKDAAAARDVMARSARNAQSGTLQVYNEVKQRKADLQDLMSGSGLNARDVSPENDWSMIADRIPLMAYAEQVLEELSEVSRDEATVQSESDRAKRAAEVLAMIGVVIANEGMDEADDPDYVLLSNEMTTSSVAVRDAIDQKNWSSVRERVGAVSQSCASCHEEYR